MNPSFQSDLADMFDADVFADDVVYIDAKTGSRTQIPAIVNLQKEYEISGDLSKSGAEAIIRISDISSPAYFDAMQIGGETYRVMRVISRDGYCATISLEKQSVPVLKK